MRIKDLQLIRYGHFEGESLEFPDAEHDIHVVYGDNEAGKTTILSAIGDALFGFPERTEYGFKHGMSKLRVAVTLQAGENEFPYVRYKKRPPTIFDDHGSEILDATKTLREYLNTADRDYFERMFLLDHGRFAAGSRALLAGGGDAGEAVLGAGGGLEGLKELLEALEPLQARRTPALLLSRDLILGDSIAQAGATAGGRLLILDALSMDVRAVRFEQDPRCAVCRPVKSG